MNRTGRENVSRGVKLGFDSDAEHLSHFCADPPAQADSKEPKLTRLQVQTKAVTLGSCGNVDRKRRTLEERV